MRVSEAKDFLVKQTAEQAQLEGVPLSELEKRMMYFTESIDASEDPVKLNDEFEAEYDTDAYESKISGLLKRANARLKNDGAESLRLWDESVRLLRKGDHYILVLLDVRPTRGSISQNSPRIWRTLILPIVFVSLLMVGFLLLSTHYGVPMRGSTTGSSGSRTYASTPLWIQRLIASLLVGGYISYVILPWIVKKLRG
jgi:preprotein translocase subunit SecG